MIQACDGCRDIGTLNKSVKNVSENFLKIWDKILKSEFSASSVKLLWRKRLTRKLQMQGTLQHY